MEARRKFEEIGLRNVRVETAHSLAYKEVVSKNNYKIKLGDYKPYEIAELLGLTGDGEKHTEYVVANHIYKFVSYFCNSDKTRVQELIYPDVVSDDKARTFEFCVQSGLKRHFFICVLDTINFYVRGDGYFQPFDTNKIRIYAHLLLFIYYIELLDMIRILQKNQT